MFASEVEKYSFFKVISDILIVSTLLGNRSHSLNLPFQWRIQDYPNWGTGNTTEILVNVSDPHPQKKILHENEDFWSQMGGGIRRVRPVWIHQSILTHNRGYKYWTTTKIV